jgi:hypothetical protein
VEHGAERECDNHEDRSGNCHNSGNDGNNGDVCIYDDLHGDNYGDDVYDYIHSHDGRDGDNGAVQHQHSQRQ